MTQMPVVFLSHGAPNLVLHATPAHDFLKSLGQKLPRPKAILVVTAHFESDAPAVTIDAKPETIYDFGGFEKELYTITYPADGDPVLATKLVQRLVKAGIPANGIADRGFDHGTWVPLKLMYPAADIPVVQLSVQPKAGPAHHLAVGRTLRELREEGVLIVASGALTHNLHEFFRGGYTLNSPAPDWVKNFGEWMREAIESGKTEALLDYRKSAPFGRENHPSEEHLLPLFAALGAAEGETAKRIHSSEEYGVLMMDVYQFGMPA